MKRVASLIMLLGLAGTAWAEERSDYVKWFINLPNCDLNKKAAENPKDPLIRFFKENQKDLGMSAKILPKGIVANFLVETQELQAKDVDVWVFNLSDKDTPISMVATTRYVPKDPSKWEAGFPHGVKSGHLTKIKNVRVDKNEAGISLTNFWNSKPAATCVVILNDSLRVNKKVINKLLQAGPNDTRSLLGKLQDAKRYQGEFEYLDLPEFGPKKTAKK